MIGGIPWPIDPGWLTVWMGRTTTGHLGWHSGTRHQARRVGVAGESAGGGEAPADDAASRADE